tara:strand:+ start:135 stop:476 length:342 start_codon:yes stop_codon:yes gene_type:complete
MDIANMDIRIRSIQNELKRKQLELVNKYRELREKAKENELLVEVADDYKKYYEYITSCKERQYNALASLTKYLDNVNNEVGNTESILKSTTEDQKMILRELGNIKLDLDRFKL